jgi:hypothetical protein
LLCVHGLCPTAEGKRIPRERLRQHTAERDGTQLTFLYLGIRKAEARAEVVVLSADEKPLTTLPLRSAKRKPTPPLELRLGSATAQAAELIICLRGTREFTIRVAPDLSGP